MPAQEPTLIRPTLMMSASGAGNPSAREKSKMSYYFTYVLVPCGTKDVEHRVHSLMAKFHNDLQVEQYETECFCDRPGEGFDPDCEECRGTGKYLTTWNPMSMFDCYIIWDSTHVLRNASKNPADWEDEEVFDDDIPDDIGAAVAPLDSLDLERLKLPFAIVDPFGNWHEMDGDWWSENQDSADWKKWRSIAHDLFAKWPNASLVVVNCHS